MVLRFSVFTVLNPKCKTPKSSPEQTDLYILTPEKVRGEAFTELVSRLTTSSSLARVVIDEAHLTATWSNFRQALRDIRYALVRVPSTVPRVFLSATVPPQERSSLISIHGERRASLFSMPTVRRNLEFVVLKCEGELKTRNTNGKYTGARQRLLQTAVDVLKTELDKISRSQLQIDCKDGKDLPFFRVLVYVMRRQDVEEYADILTTSYIDLFPSETDVQKNLDLQVSVLQYHAAMSLSEKESMYEIWSTPRWGRKQEDSRSSVKVVLMVSTCAFGTGIDASNVRLVLHIGGSTSLKDYAQEAGRAGRDGAHARCVALYSTPLADNFQSELEIVEAETHSHETHTNLTEWVAMRNWMENSTVCRKNWLYEIMDGVSPGICMFDELSNNCDVCKSRFEGDPKVRQLGAKRSLSIPSVTQPSEILQHNQPTKRISSGSQSVYFSDVVSQPSAIAISLSHIIAKCELIVREFDLVCLPCYISSGRYIRIVDHDRCPFAARRCFNCFSHEHGCRKCPNKIKSANGTCFRCGMSYSKGHRIHSEEMGFGNSCKLEMLRSLGWCLWRKGRAQRKKMVQELFDDTTAECYNTSGDPNISGSSPQVDIVLAQWMSRKTFDTPNLLRLGSWWAETR